MNFIGVAQDHADFRNPTKWKGENLLGYALMEVRELLIQLDIDGPLKNPVLPPWLAHPETERYSIGWRMGYGEGHMMDLNDYFKTLTTAQKKAYKLTFPAGGEWQGWYEN